MVSSIIEKALDASGEWSSTSGVFHRDLLAEEQKKLSFDSAPPVADAETDEPTRQFDLDLNKLRKLGIIHPQRTNTEIVEEYRRIKQPLLHRMSAEASHRGTHFNLIGVTSAIAGEGKTFTALNLAISMAMEKDRTVLLVDSDMIKRGLSQLVGIDSYKGLADLLQDGQTALGEVLLRTNIAKLAVLPAGQCEAHYTELVGSSAMRRLSQQLALRYPERVIIFDTPPLLTASATRVLANLMDQVVMIVEVGKTPRKLIQEAMLLLGDSKPIGIVLNKTAKTSWAKY